MPDQTTICTICDFKKIDVRRICPRWHFPICCFYNCDCTVSYRIYQSY